MRRLLKLAVVGATVFAFATALGTLGYLLLAPIVMKGPTAFRPRMLDLEGARNYYTLLSAAVGSIAGTAGLMLGAYYYFDKLGRDDERSARERTRARIDELHKRIDGIDQDVLNLMFRDDTSVDRKREAYKVVRALGALEQVLARYNKGEISDEEMGAVLRLNSYLERRCRAALEAPQVGNGATGALAAVVDPDEYGDLLYDARRALHACAQRAEPDRRG